MIGRALLDLKRAVVDRKALVKFMGNLIHEGIRGISGGGDQMDGESAFGGAHVLPVDFDRF